MLCLLPSCITDALDRGGVSTSSSTLINSVTIMSETEKQYIKQARKEEKKIIKAVKQLDKEDNDFEFDPSALRNKR